jgi:hypothetical protein
MLNYLSLICLKINIQLMIDSNRIMSLTSIQNIYLQREKNDIHSCPSDVAKTNISGYRICCEL